MRASRRCARVVHHLLTRREDYRDLFTTRQTFISPALAPIYKVAAPKPGWTPHEFSAGQPVCRAC